MAYVVPYGILRSVGLGPAEIVLLEHGVSPARFVFVFVGRARARSFCLLQSQRGFLEHLRPLILKSKIVYIYIYIYLFLLFVHRYMYTVNNTTQTTNHLKPCRRNHNQHHVT